MIRGNGYREGKELSEKILIVVTVESIRAILMEISKGEDKAGRGLWRALIGGGCGN